MRERRFIAWLDQVAVDAQAIFLVGDIFDFWFEYKRVIPKGFSRLLGKFSELTDRGVEIHFFPGNHDLWAFDYLHEECGVTLHGEYALFQLCDRRVFVGHGDALGKSDFMGRLLSRMFRTRWIQGACATLLHPNLFMKFGAWWSGSNRKAKPIRHTFRGEGEPMVRFARRFLENEPIELFVCGHVHVAEVYALSEGSKIAFLGEWIEEPTYGVLSEQGFTLERYQG